MKKGETKSRKQSALQYAEHRWPVVPLYSASNGQCTCGKESCERPGKHPMTHHGVKDATTHAEQIERWWNEWPKANIGLAPGRECDLVVLDIDPRHGGDRTLRKLERKLGPLPDTLTVKTGGGGSHLFFRHPKFRVRKDNAGKLLGRGIDVLSDGCMVVAPPRGRGGRFAYEVLKACDVIREDDADEEFVTETLHALFSYGYWNKRFEEGLRFFAKPKTDVVYAPVLGPK